MRPVTAEALSRQFVVEATPCRDPPAALDASRHGMEVYRASGPSESCEPRLVSALLEAAASMVMMTIEGLAVWATLAFVLWLLIRFTLDFLRLRHAGIAAAILSWLIARVMLTVLPPILQWLQTHHLT
jgi:hypothetical protein